MLWNQFQQVVVTGHFLVNFIILLFARFSTSIHGSCEKSPLGPPNLRPWASPRTLPYFGFSSERGSVFTLPFRIFSTALRAIYRTRARSIRSKRTETTPAITVMTRAFIKPACAALTPPLPSLYPHSAYSPLRDPAISPARENSTASGCSDLPGACCASCSPLCCTPPHISRA
jgi:hypothetical protein